MMIARTLSRLLVAAGFAVSSLAFAQGQTETPAAAPDRVAPEVAPQAAAPEGDPAPARSVLWPDFQVGQHVVLEMTYLDTSKFAKPIFATINVEVIDKTDDVFTIRWTPSNTRLPRGFPSPAMAPYICVWNGTAGPTLDILIQEDLGVIGLANWEAARDQAVADATNALVGLKGSDGVEITPEMAAENVQALRDTILANKDATEATLLRNVRGYFDGAYHEVAPGEVVTEDLELPWPFGDEEGLYLPATRTTRVEEPAAGPTPIYVLHIEIAPDRERFKALVNSLTETVAAKLKGPELAARAESAVSIKVRWQLDMSKGWTTRASSNTRITNETGLIINAVTWTLTQGPTMKADEPKPDAAPPSPAPSDASADPR